MKKLLLVPALLVSLLSISQTVSISHQGLSPSDEMTVHVGETITFNYGGGGNHPMKEGWNSGEVSTPAVFATQTVSSSIPSVTFTIDVAGIYYYHCDTNPGNQANWGKITVLAAEGTNGVEEEEIETVSLFPNPATNVLNISGIVTKAIIYNSIGEKVLETTESSVNIEDLPNGVYIVDVDGVNHKFVKQ